VLADAVTWVKDAVETRKNLRRTRRYRNTPCRVNRKNRARGGIPPSTKARWGLKLRIVNQLRKMFPITGYAVEDVKATTYGKRERWNKSFSPLEAGKYWMYGELSKLGTLTLKAGHETAELRKQYGLVKDSDKMALRFAAHNIDSWVLAKDRLNAQGRPENTRLTHCRPLQFRRRALHLQNPAKGNVRRSHGGTLSAGIKRGSLAKHPKHGLCTVGGTIADRGISLHELSGKRLCQNAKGKDITLLKRISLIFTTVRRNGIPLSAKADSLLPKT